MAKFALADTVSRESATKLNKKKTKNSEYRWIIIGKEVLT